jgi:purine-cytosine permease-like protein
MTTCWRALGVLAMIAIYLATVAADIVNDYTGSLSVQAAGITSAGR